jgi:sugar phosphate isomerase/epimerase
MLIGAMNHPQEDVIDEIRWMAAMGLEFIDLTLEPPCAAAWRIDPPSIRRAIEDHGFSVVGHTAYYLPIGSPFEKVRKAAVDELKRCLDVFAEIGVKWMNVHPDRYAPMHERSFYVQRDIQSLEELLDAAHPLGLGVMVENLPGDFNSVDQLAELLEPLPKLGVHLDIGHANLLGTVNTSDSIISAYGPRLRHVHLHDNKGGNADLHLPLGVGTIDVRRHIRNLKESGYDGTITLEVFTPDHAHLAYSRDVLRRLWEEQ